MFPPVKKSKEGMLAALANNVPAEIINTADEKDTQNYKPSDCALVTDSEADYEFTRSQVKKLITTSDDAISVMLALAQDSEHPRAFEVLANLLKTSSDMNQQLISLHKERRKILSLEQNKGKVQDPGIVNNNNTIFVGTTSDLQTFLSDRLKNKISADGNDTASSSPVIEADSITI